LGELPPAPPTPPAAAAAAAAAIATLGRMAGQQHPGQLHRPLAVEDRTPHPRRSATGIYSIEPARQAALERQVLQAAAGR
jgi:hypothetical protein